MVKEDIDEEGAPAMQQKGRYLSYNSAVLADGATKVLFFKAAWCPLCIRADGTLSQWFEAGSVPITVYKVDYDTEADLKAKYGVTYQHTFVKVDGQGKMVAKLMTPTEEALKAFLGIK
jgi:thiol-disulfide isomerase/thioredoxin